MKNNLYCSSVSSSVNSEDEEREVIDLLKLDTSSEGKISSFLGLFGNRYGSETDEEKTRNVEEAAYLVRLLSYLLLYGSGSISSNNFEKRCEENGIELRVDCADNTGFFSVNVPRYYFARRSENHSDLLSFEDGFATVRVDKLLLSDLCIPSLPVGNDLERLASTVLSEKLINERATYPFIVSPVNQQFEHRSHVPLGTIVGNMFLAKKIVACPQCGRLVIRKTDKSSYFNCGVKGHHQRYIEAAQRLVRKGVPANELKAKFPFINEKTVESWYPNGGVSND